MQEGYSLADLQHQRPPVHLGQRHALHVEQRVQGAPDSELRDNAHHRELERDAHVAYEPRMPQRLQVGNFLLELCQLLLGDMAAVAQVQALDRDFLPMQTALVHGAKATRAQELAHLEVGQFQPLPRRESQARRAGRGGRCRRSRGRWNWGCHLNLHPSALHPVGAYAGGATCRSGAADLPCDQHWRRRRGDGRRGQRPRGRGDSLRLCGGGHRGGASRGCARRTRGHRRPCWPQVRRGPEHDLVADLPTHNVLDLQAVAVHLHDPATDPASGTDAPDIHGIASRQLPAPGVWIRWSHRRWARRCGGHRGAACRQHGRRRRW
mmetsp:Transcript_42999/g.135220  ORF Transcript_42999/g.135220 Transcript_42999/m.135220 type:complete len:322 (+) Transcript_42999:645-1610(+)